eukprot:TRINITY_DN6878_c0_g1_i1.p2 TRINITY_DN6878_c0_g1~~TRINITY_DN6878_c0_g1_i1.p2  ORF type:complete len:53 (+),score=14.42 TRINITY_DN6878_c0_g1_i1:32-160(+)
MVVKEDDEENTMKIHVDDQNNEHNENEEIKKRKLKRKNAGSP